MAVTAKIKFVQGVNTPPAGEALDGVTGVSVTASNDNNTDVAFWTWTIVDVAPGSAISIGTTGSASTFSFTPDVAGGCYLIRLVVQNSDQSRNAIFYLAVVVKDVYGRWWPPFGADDKMVNIGGQTRGWMPAFDSYKPMLDRLRDIGPTAPTDGQVLKWIAANNRLEYAASNITLTGAVTGSGSGSVATTLSGNIDVSKLAAGSDGQVLKTSGSSVVWGMVAPTVPPLLGASTTRRWLCNDAAGSGTVVDDVGAANMTVQNASAVNQGDTGLYCDSITFRPAGTGWAKTANGFNPTSTTALSFHGWVKFRSTSNTAYARLLTKLFSANPAGIPSASFEILLDNLNGSLFVQWASSGANKSSTPFSNAAFGRPIIIIGDWHYIAATFSQASGNATIAVYVDGNLMGTPEVVASGPIDWNGGSGGPFALGAVTTITGTAIPNAWLFDWRVEDGVAMTQAQERTHDKIGSGLSY